MNSFVSRAIRKMIISTQEQGKEVKIFVVGEKGRSQLHRQFTQVGKCAVLHLCAMAVHSAPRITLSTATVSCFCIPLSLLSFAEALVAEISNDALAQKKGARTSSILGLSIMGEHLPPNRLVPRGLLSVSYCMPVVVNARALESRRHCFLLLCVPGLIPRHKRNTLSSYFFCRNVHEQQYSDTISLLHPFLLGDNIPITSTTNVASCAA